MQVLLMNMNDEIGRITLNDGRVEFRGKSAEMIRDSMNIIDPESRDRSYPSDGENYLRAVVANLSRSAYFYAVMDSNDDGVPDEV